MGFLNDNISSNRGERGLTGRGITSITSTDNENGTITLTINYSDGTLDTFTNNLISDTLIQLDKLTLEGTNDATKFQIKNNETTSIFNVNSDSGLTDILSLSTDKFNINKKFYFISTKDDFPTPVNGVITLSDNKTYYLTAHIDLNGDRIVGGANTVILGASSENCSLSSTGLGNFIPLFSSAWTTTIRHITFTGCHTAIDIQGTILSQPVALDWTGVNFLDVPNVGTIGDIGNFIFSKGGLLNSSGLVFTGSIETIGIDNSIFTRTVADSGAIIQIDTDAIITRRFRIIYSSFVIGGANNKGIDVNVNASIPIESYILDTINFTVFGGGVAVSGVIYTDNKVRWIACKGIINTSVFGNFYFSGNLTTLIPIIGNIGTPINFTYISSGLNQKFILTEGYKFRYVGSLLRDFQISVCATLESAFNQRLEYSMNIIKETSEISNAVSGGSMSGTTTNIDKPINITCQGIAELTLNDSIWIGISCDDNNAILVSNINVIIKALN